MSDTIETLIREEAGRVRERKRKQVATALKAAHKATTGTTNRYDQSRDLEEMTG